MTGHTVILYDRSRIGSSGSDSFGKLYDELAQDSAYSGKIMPIKSLTEIRDKVQSFLKSKNSGYIEILIIHGHGKEGLIGVGGGYRASVGEDTDGTITKSTLGSQVSVIKSIADALTTAMPTNAYPPIILFTSCESGGGSKKYAFVQAVSEKFEGCVILLAQGSTCVRKVEHRFGSMYKISKVSNDLEGDTVSKWYFVPGYNGASGYKDVEEYTQKEFPYSDQTFEAAVTL